MVPAWRPNSPTRSGADRRRLCGASWKTSSVVWLRPVTTALVALALLGACGAGTNATTGAKSGHGSAASVASRRLDDRPPLVLVRRDGDPFPAVAFAVTTETPLAAAATSAALRARLAARGFAVRLQPSALGFSLSALVANAAEARRFVASGC